MNEPATGPALTLVRIAARLVPGGRRDEWLREWAAELETLDRHMDERGVPRSRRRRELLARAAGAPVDALHLLGEGMTMGEWTRDLTLATRTLRRRPGYALVAAFTLALGIGAATTVFSVVDGVLLRPLPYQEPERLTRVLSTREDGGGGSEGLGVTVSYPEALDLADEAASVAGVAAVDEWDAAVHTEVGPEVVQGATVSASFFRLLGVEAALGRVFRGDEEGPGREPGAILGHGLWVRSFGADPGVVGRTVDVSGTAYTVLGVLPADFQPPGLTGEGWVPEIWRTPWFAVSDRPRSGRSWTAVARLAPGVSLEAARGEVRAVGASMAARYPEDSAGRGLDVVPLREHGVEPARRALVLLMAAVGLLLVVACVNVSGLVLSRTLDRRGELAVRAALGAGRGRLVRGVLAEGVVLGLAGALGGLALAAVATPRVVALAGEALPRGTAVTVDLRIALFAGVAGLVAATLVGLLPALRTAGQAAAPVLRLGGGRGGDDPRSRRTRRLLVQAQLALAVVLAVGAGLLARSLAALNAEELGFHRAGVVTAELHGSGFWDLEPEEAAARWRGIREAVEALPGVVAAGAVDYLPLDGGYSCDGVHRADRPPPLPGEGRCAEVRSTLPGYLEALGVEVLRGRALEPADRLDALRSAVVGAALARDLWSGPDEALGGRLQVHGDTFTVVGVARDVRAFGPLGADRPLVYLPVEQEPWNGATRGLSLVARTDGDVGALAAALPGAVHAVAPDVPVNRVRTMHQLMASNVSAPRFRATLLLVFAVTALLLAVVGVAGVVAYAVGRRTAEIGVRLAIGARREEVVGLLLRDGLVTVLGGTLLGLAAAVLASSLLAPFLFGVEPRDPAVLLGAPAVLSLAGLLAAWIPARRAAHVDPVRALRRE